MSSSLAAQLQRISERSGQQKIAANAKASFLFDAKEAASLDSETVWQLGQSGLSELAAMDGRFRNFERTLFTREGLKTHREDEGERFWVTVPLFYPSS